MYQIRDRDDWYGTHWGHHEDSEYPNVPLFELLTEKPLALVQGMQGNEEYRFLIMAAEHEWRDEAERRARVPREMSGFHPPLFPADFYALTRALMCAAEYVGVDAGLLWDFYVETTEHIVFEWPRNDVPTAKPTEGAIAAYQRALGVFIRLRDLSTLKGLDAYPAPGQERKFESDNEKDVYEALKESTEPLECLRIVALLESRGANIASKASVSPILKRLYNRGFLVRVQQGKRLRGALKSRRV